MCIGIPMQVVQVQEGFAQVFGRSEQKRVSTLLVGDCIVGEWLLIFLSDAREKISSERAAEINATLDLLDNAYMSHAGLEDAAFALPSAMSSEQVAALTSKKY